jgi:HlyD family secretion protein
MNSVRKAVVSEAHFDKDGEAKTWTSQACFILMKKSFLKFALVAIVVILIAGSGLYAASNRPVDVKVASVQTNVPIRVFGLGTVEARILSKIGFEVGATLVELKADHGDRVRKGDVLAQLSLGEQEAKVARASANVLSSEVGIGRAEANFEKASAVFAQKQEANRRKQTLADRHIVSEQTAEEAVRDEAVASADVSVARTEIAVARAMLADARAQLRFEQTMLQHRTLVAPYDALVVERHKEQGTVIKPGDPIFTLIAADTYWGLAYVDEARAGYIDEGQKVDGRMRSRPMETFTGQVVRIGLESDRVSEERRVYVKGNNPPSRLHLGEQTEFWITVATLDTALFVPEAAVHGYDGRQGTVWTVEAGRLQRRLVGFRHRTEDASLEIVSGLPEKAEVVTSVVAGLKEGRLARVTAEPTASAGRPAR